MRNDPCTQGSQFVCLFVVSCVRFLAYAVLAPGLPSSCCAAIAAASLSFSRLRLSSSSFSNWSRSLLQSSRSVAHESHCQRIAHLMLTSSDSLPRISTLYICPRPNSQNPHIPMMCFSSSGSSIAFARSLVSSDCCWVSAVSFRWRWRKTVCDV